MTSKPRIPNVLAGRYASVALAELWSPEHKIVLERRLWLAVLAAQSDLGIDVPDGVETTPEECTHIQYGWMQSAVAADADIIVVAPSIWDLADASFDDGPLVEPGDPSHDEQAGMQVGEINRALLRAAPTVVWLGPPAMSWHAREGDADVATLDTDRAASYTALLRSSATGATVVDLAEIDGAPRAFGPAAEVDGFGVEPGERAALGERLGSALLAAG